MRIGCAWTDYAAMRTCRNRGRSMQECRVDRRNEDAIELKRGCCAASSYERIGDPTLADAIVPNERL